MCNCGNSAAPTQAVQEKRYLVHLPNGTTVTVNGEHAAKVEVTMAGGGTYSVIR